MHRQDIYQDENLLLRDFKEGNNDAFKYFFNSFYNSLLHYVTRFVKSEPVAEDIIADAFVVLWKKKSEFNSIKSIGKFLYTVTKNASFGYLRHTKMVLRTSGEVAYFAELADKDVAAKAMREDLIQLSLIASSNLPGKMKEVFEMLFIEGFTTSEVAERLNLSIHTVRAQKGNAVKKIREILIQQGLISAISLLTLLEASQNLPEQKTITDNRSLSIRPKHNQDTGLFFPSSSTFLSN